VKNVKPTTKISVKAVFFLFLFFSSNAFLFDWTSLKTNKTRKTFPEMHSSFLWILFSFFFFIFVDFLSFFSFFLFLNLSFFSFSDHSCLKLDLSGGAAPSNKDSCKVFQTLLKIFCDVIQLFNTPIK
jgi:hypothetical protein